MRVQVDRDDGLVRSVLLVDDQGAPVESACRFLRYVVDTGGSPNTAVAYGYDLRYLFEFLTDRELDWRQFQPSVAFDLLGWLRQRPCRRRVQQLSLQALAISSRCSATSTTHCATTCRPSRQCSTPTVEWRTCSAHRPPACTSAQLTTAGSEIRRKRSACAWRAPPR